jgi:transposase
MPSSWPSGRRASPTRRTAQRGCRRTLTILKGEALDALSRELKVSTSRLAQWRDEFMAGGQASLKSREPDHRDEQICAICPHRRQPCRSH